MIWIKTEWPINRCFFCNKDLTNAEEYVEYIPNSKYFTCYRLCLRCSKKDYGFCPDGTRREIRKIKRHRIIVIGGIRWKPIHNRK